MRAAVRTASEQERPNGKHMCEDAHLLAHELTITFQKTPSEITNAVGKHALRQRARLAQRQQLRSVESLVK